MPTSVKPIATQGEHYLYTPTPPNANAVQLAWVYPYTYAVAMASLGYLALFRLLDERPDVSVKRYSTETYSDIPLTDTELMGFSFSFELDIVEILTGFQTMGIPTYAADRTADHALVFAGGPVVITNPEPYAPFFDFFLIGDGEPTLGPLMTAIQETRHITNRRDRLLELAIRVPGVYVPSLIDVTYHDDGIIAAMTPADSRIPFPVEKQADAAMGDQVAYTPIVSDQSIFASTFMVEVMRGCAHRCRFCLASYSALPARGPTVDSIIKAIELGSKSTKKVGLVGALITEHPEFEALCHYLQGRDDLEVTVASVRADTLTPTIVETLKKGGQQTVTIAIESGSERLRHRINKHLKTEAIQRAVQLIADAGIPNLKLYMMIGLPDEQDRDLDDTIALVKSLKKAHPQLKIHVGCSTFVPKAATPFQWMPREITKQLDQKHAYLRKHLARYCSFRPSIPKWDTLQAVLSRGDRRLAPFLVDFVEQGGKMGAINRALKHGQFDGMPDLVWYGQRQRDEHEILPWDGLFLGVPKTILYKESGLALAAPSH